MPSLIVKRGRRRYLGAIMVAGNRRSRLFADASRRSYRMAALWEDEARMELERNGGELITLTDWAERYLEYARVRFMEKTYRSKAAAFGRLLGFMGGQRIAASISEDDCLRYLTIQANRRTGNAANRDRKEFGAAYQFGRQYLGFPALNPWRLVVKFPEEKYSRYMPPMRDFEQVLGVAIGQDRAMLTALLHLAARKSELFGLRWCDIDHDNCRIRLFTRKRRGGNREEDWLPATGLLLETLKEWEAVRGSTRLPGRKPDREYVFVSMVTGRRFRDRDDFLKRLCLKAGVRRFSFHSIRHLTAMTLYRAGATTQHIQLVLRHQDPRTTSKYLRRIGIEEVRETLEGTLVKNPVVKGVIDPPAPPFL